MLYKQAVSAIAALSLASGVVSLSCEDETVQVNSPGDALEVGKCGEIEGSVEISKSASGVLDFGGLESVGGSFSAKDAINVTAISADFLTTIGNEFNLNNLVQLSRASFISLGSIGAASWTILTALDHVELGAKGITTAKSFIIADTKMTSLKGINVDNLSSLDLNNNNRMSVLESGLKTLSDTLYINNNGLNLTASFPNLRWAANLTIANVTTFNAPSLKTVNGSARFYSNYFTRLAFPNLTECTQGDFASIGNAELTNISVPLLTKIGGGFTLANNTELVNLDGFDKLDFVGGAMVFRGNFEELAFPAIETVRGDVDIESEGDITMSCDTLKASGADFQTGDIHCEPNVQDANEDTDATGSNGGDDSNQETPPNGAGILGMNMSTLATLAALSAIFTAFL